MENQYGGFKIMPTLWEKFPGVSRITDKISIYPIACRFSAPLIAGRFEFSKVLSFAFVGSAGEAFVLDGCTLASNVDQLTFNNSLDPLYNNGVFSLDIKQDGNGHLVTLAPFRFSAFNQGGEFSANWSPTGTNNNQESFSLLLDGALIQTPAIIAAGLLSVDIVVTANIYRVKQNLLRGE
jgi:hypothetical protein